MKCRAPRCAVPIVKLFGLGEGVVCFGALHRICRVHTLSATTDLGCEIVFGEIVMLGLVCLNIWFYFFPLRFFSFFKISLPCMERSFSRWVF
jgi:hypothetical protein